MSAIPHPAQAQTAPSLNRAERRWEIDGLRGWAALCVLGFHLVWETFGVVHPSFRSPWLKACLDGPLAVLVFFVLSGDSLSMVWTRRRPETPAEPEASTAGTVVLRRYFRLAGPVLLSSLTVYALMALGATWTQAVAPVVERPDWYGEFLRFAPSLGGAIRFGLAGAFGIGPDGQDYNPFLWTMPVEMLGSLVVFAMGSFYGRLRRPATVLVVSSVFLAVAGSYLALFVFGMLLGELRARGVFERWHRDILARVLCPGLISILGFVDAHAAQLNLTGVQARIVLACALVTLVYGSKDLVTGLRTRLSRHLGRISFPLYYMQFPVLVSLTAWLVVTHAHAAHDSSSAALAIVGVSVLATWTLARGVCVLEEMYLRALQRWASQELLRAALNRGG